MYQPVIERFAMPPGLPEHPDAYLAHVVKIYVTDTRYRLTATESVQSLLAALEEASVRQNIVPFSDFIAGSMETGLEGQ